MKSIFLSIILATCVFWQTNAGNGKIDSLKRILNSSGLVVDTNQINALNALAAEYRNSNPDTAFILTDKALTLAKKINYRKGIANALRNRAIINSLKANYSEALSNCFESLKISEEINDKTGTSKTLGNIGTIYNGQSDYPRALEYFFKSLKLKEELNDKSGIATTLGNIGIVYYAQADYPLALEYYFKALKMDEELGNKSGIARHLGNIGIVYKSQSNYPKAHEYYFKALEINQKLGNKHAEASVLGNIGNVYSSQGNYSTALEYDFKALKITEEIGDKNGIARHLGNIGVLYFNTGKFSEAEKYLKNSLELADNISALYLTRDFENYLSRLYDTTGRIQLALLHFKKYIIARDSLKNDENTKKMVQQQMLYEFDKIQTADSLKIAEERVINEVKFEQEKTQRYFLYGGLALVALFGAFMFNRFKITQKQNNIISEQKHLIEERHKEITDSINYAERIQRSFLATKQHLDENLSEYFILFKPKDVVSGDFYWSATLNNSLFALATADSTGHGVPGAIMSLLNISSLEMAVKDKLTEPAEILNYSRKEIISRLKKDGSTEGGKDGMDCSLCVYDLKNMKLFIAAANNPVWVVRGEEVIEIKPDKMPVGKHDKQDIPFTQHEINLQKGDVVYTLSDGFPDQFGGENGKKFMIKNLRQLIAKNAHLPLNEQKQLLETTFTNWIDNLEQVDDVVVIGVRV